MQEEDIEALQQRDYSKVKVCVYFLFLCLSIYILKNVKEPSPLHFLLQDASLLRFMVDMRGEDADDRQVLFLHPLFIEKYIQVRNKFLEKLKQSVW